MLQLSQRSLTASDADAELFSGRDEEIARVQRAIALGFNCFITGVPGSGKTTLLRQLTRELDDLQPVFLAGTAAASLPALLGRDGGRDSGTGVVDAVPPRLVEFLEAAPHDGARLLVVIDDASVALLAELFGRARDELWELPMQWVVASSSTLRPPADAFFEAVVTLSPLLAPEAQELLVRRSATGDKNEARTVAKLAHQIPDLLGPVQPRQLLAAARFVLLAAEPDEALNLLQDNHDARLLLSDTAARVLHLLTVIGPTYAGDERLLKELGMTRNRIVQVFGELEAAGLVMSERSGKRKLYGPTMIGG